MLAPQSLKRGLSYACGILNIFSWITIVVSIGFIIPQFITALALFYHPTYVPQPWHAYLEFVAITLFSMCFNLFVLRKAEWTHNFACEL